MGFLKTLDALKCTSTMALVFVVLITFFVRYFLIFKFIFGRIPRGHYSTPPIMSVCLSVSLSLSQVLALHFPV